MKWLRHIALAALALVGTLGLTQTAKAQGVAGSKAVPAPIQRQWIANERIYMEVFVDNAERPGNNPEGKGSLSSFPYGEHYGNRLGSVIPMRVRIFCILPNGDKVQVTPSANPDTANQALPKAVLDFQGSLLQGRLTVDQDPENDPDWVFAKKELLGPNEQPLELPKEPRLVTIQTPDGVERQAELWDIRLFVQTRRRPEPMLFWLEFGYATEVNANGQKEWKRADTPDFIISGSYTSDKGRDLEIGNTNQVEQARPLGLAMLLAGVGALMVLLPAGLMVVRAVQRALAKPATEAVTPAQFWATVDPVLTACKSDNGYCFEPNDVTLVLQTFKQYIGYSGGVFQFKRNIGEYENGETIYKLLYALEHQVLERGELSEERQREGHTTPGLSDKRYGQVIAAIEKLIPRP